MIWEGGRYTVSSRNPNTDALDRSVLSIKFRLYVRNNSGRNRESIFRRTRSPGVVPSGEVEDGLLDDEASEYSEAVETAGFTWSAPIPTAHGGSAWWSAEE